MFALVFACSSNVLAQDETLEKPSKPVPKPKVETTISTPDGYTEGHGYVDLGLSVKWATCNVGASEISERGNLYAWGELFPKSEYTEENCVTYGKNMDSIEGDPQYDVACADWSGTWRLPTKEEFEELIAKCKRKWAVVNGQEGLKLIGPNGKSIFLPCSWESDIDKDDKRAFYWSATPTEREYYEASKNAYYFFFRSGDLWRTIDSSDKRYVGRLIRPVLGKTITKENSGQVTEPAVWKLTGCVTDEMGEPMVGALVQCKRKSKGSLTITDIEGNYSLEVLKGDTLNFQFAGWNDVVIIIDHQTDIINVQMREK